MTEKTVDQKYSLLFPKKTRTIHLLGTFTVSCHIPQRVCPLQVARLLRGGEGSTPSGSRGRPPPAVHLLPHQLSDQEGGAHARRDARRLHRESHAPISTDVPHSLLYY